MVLEGTILLDFKPTVLVGINGQVLDLVVVDKGIVCVRGNKIMRNILHRPTAKSH